MNREDLIQRIGAEAYVEACRIARADAERPDYGRGEPMFDSDIPQELAELVWGDRCDVSDALDLIITLYGDMPCYWYLASIKIRFGELTTAARNRFWDWVRARLTSGDRALCAPIEYALWSEFFEDPKTVREAWRELGRSDLSRAILKAVLNTASAAPYAYKSVLYDALLPDPTWHHDIYLSLLHSAFDVYGDVNHAEASRVLSKLHLTPEPEHLDRLRAKLAAPADGRTGACT